MRDVSLAPQALTKLEKDGYTALAVAAMLVAAGVAPLLAGFFGILSQTTADGLAEAAAMMLALPAFVVLTWAAVLSIIIFLRGPNRVRLRLLLWYVVAPGLFVGSLLCDPQRGNSFSPIYDTLATIGLGLGCVLPLLWRRKMLSRPNRRDS